MRVRYTDPATFELEAGIWYFREHAPSVVADFADSIDRAVAELLDHPYSAQETEQLGVRRKYARRFQYSIFYAVEGDEVFCIFDTPPVAGHGKTRGVNQDTGLAYGGRRHGHRSDARGGRARPQ